jgi:large subunit ribosomal protein L18
MTAQLINDDAGTTLVYATSAGRGEALPLSAKAEQVGTAIGQKARTAKLNQAVFDRGARRYHGRVAKLADAARQAGLEF